MCIHLVLPRFTIGTENFLGCLEGITPSPPLLKIPRKTLRVTTFGFWCCHFFNFPAERIQNSQRFAGSPAGGKHTTIGVKRSDDAKSVPNAIAKPSATADFGDERRRYGRERIGHEDFAGGL